MITEEIGKQISNKRIFLLLVLLSFSIFLFTVDGHRSSFDEDVLQLSTERLVTLKPHPLFIENESKILFEYPYNFPNPKGPICQNPILCSASRIGQNILAYPFVSISYNLGLDKYVILLNPNDFDDPNYLLWRNGLDSIFTLLEVGYGPIFSSLSIGLFFLVSRIYYSYKTSIILSLILALGTPVWMYSDTTFSVMPTLFFVLFAFYFLKKFQKSNFKKHIMLCSISLAMLFLIRPDNALIIIPFMGMFFYDLRKKIKRIKNSIIFLSPFVISFFIIKMIDVLNFGKEYLFKAGTFNQINDLSGFYTNPLIGAYGLLFSPGFGLFIFAPVFFIVFIGFSNFFKSNKKDTILFISTISTLLIFYGSVWFWFGGYSWSARYFMPVIPFMLIPIGTVLEKKGKKLLYAVLGLSAIGFFVNFVSVIQDISWFVWGFPGQWGLASLADNWSKFNTHESVIWTFENSQLIKSIELAFSKLQVDIFLFKILGKEAYFAIVVIVMTGLSYMLIKTIKNSNVAKNTLDIE